MFALPELRWYLGATVGIFFAVQMQAVAVGWRVFSLRQQPLDLGLVGLAIFLPTLFLVFPAGVIADRYDRRLILIVSLLLEMLCSVTFALFVAYGVRAIAPYFVVLVVVGIARAFVGPAQRTLLINIVAREQYVPAQSITASLRELANVIGPALGGALLIVGVEQAFIGTAIVFALAALSCVPLRPHSFAAQADPPSFRSAIAGIRFLREQPVILGAITLDVCAVFFGGVEALLPVYAAVILSVGPFGLGLMRSALACGAALTAIYLVRRPPQQAIGRTLLVTVGIFGAATIAFAASKIFVLSLIALALVGGSDMVSVVIRNALVQLNTPDAMRGRVTAVEMVFINASNELGAFESGTLAAFIGTIPAVALGGVAALAFVAIWPFVFPALARAKRLTV